MKIMIQIRVIAIAVAAEVAEVVVVRRMRAQPGKLARAQRIQMVKPVMLPVMPPAMMAEIALHIAVAVAVAQQEMM
jgi:hypothetical protein